MTIQINPKLGVKTNLLNLIRNTNPAFSRVTEDMFVLLETGSIKVPNSQIVAPVTREIQTSKGLKTVTFHDYFKIGGNPIQGLRGEYTFYYNKANLADLQLAELVGTDGNNNLSNQAKRISEWLYPVYTKYINEPTNYVHNGANPLGITWNAANLTANDLATGLANSNRDSSLNYLSRTFFAMLSIKLKLPLLYFPSNTAMSAVDNTHTYPFFISGYNQPTTNYYRLVLKPTDNTDYPYHYLYKNQLTIYCTSL